MEKSKVQIAKEKAQARAKALKSLGENDKYITPTKESPIFLADCDWFGYIELSLYKQYKATYPDGNTSNGPTFDIHFKSAVNRLHEWIEDNPETITDYPKSKFNIYLVDGTMEKGSYPELKRTVVYTISAAKAKKLLSV